MSCSGVCQECWLYQCVSTVCLHPSACPPMSGCLTVSLSVLFVWVAVCLNVFEYVCCLYMSFCQLVCMHVWLFAWQRDRDIQIKERQTNYENRDRQIGGSTCKQADIQTGRQTDWNRISDRKKKKIDWQTCRHTNINACIHTDVPTACTAGDMHRWTDVRTCRQADRF